jgi:hypothetical protein
MCTEENGLWTQYQTVPVSTADLQRTGLPFESEYVDKQVYRSDVCWGLPISFLC